MFYQCVNITLYVTFFVFIRENVPHQQPFGGNSHLAVIATAKILASMSFWTYST